MTNSPDISFATAAAIKSVQEEKLKAMLQYMKMNSPFYRRLFSEKQVNTDSIHTLEDLVVVPTTTKSDMQQYNWDFLCVPREKIVDYSATSGTMGSPVTIALTEKDLDRLSVNEYGSFVCADGTSYDIYQLQLTLDRQFMAGIAYFTGLRKLGAGIIRLGSGTPVMQWESIQRLHPTVVVGVPSQILKLVDYCREAGVDLNSCSVKKAVCIGENIRNPDFSLNTLGNLIREAWNIQLYSTYASTEMQTAFTECKAGRGGHVQPELVILEILDDDGNPVADGQQGEVTITTLGVEGMPLLRYRTGDLCIRHSDPCACGRNTPRLSPVLGRKQQMIKLKGTTLYPPVLFELLNGMKEIKDYVIEVNSNELGTDEVVLHLQAAIQNQDFTPKVRAELQARLRVIPKILWVSAEEMRRMQFPEGSRKAQLFKDHRIISGNLK